jgi:hypothetical protein
MMRANKNQTTTGKEMAQEEISPTTAIDAFATYITQALITECGSVNRRKIELCIKRKHTTILKDLAKIYFSPVRHSWFASNPDIKVMLLKTLERSWGRITLDGKQRRLNALLSRYLFTTLRVGTTGTASAIQFTKPVVTNAILEFVSQQEAVPLPDDEIIKDEDADYFVTAINLPSLRHYLGDVCKQLTTKSYAVAAKAMLTKMEPEDKDEGTMDRIIASKRQKLERNLHYANAIAKSVNDNGELWQEANPSAAGRLYLKGVNLQAAPKEVRHAALGYSVAYDLRCGALGVLAALANCLSDGEWNFPAIRDYIKHRNDIREVITRSIYPVAKHYRNIKDFHGYHKVKEAFTAIGFGARKTVGGSWKNEAGKWKTSSLKDILDDQAEAFLTHRLSKDIIAEYELAAKVVLAAYKLNDEFRDYLNENSDIDPAMTSKQLLAHIYQHFESAILDRFVIGAIAQGATLLLPLHDGAYFDRAVDHQSIWWMMRLPFISDKSFIQFERAEYVSWTAKDTYQQKVNEHKAFMQLQEQAAESYVPRHTYV